MVRKESTRGFLLASLLAFMLGCSPSQPAEPEPLPESIVKDLTAREREIWDASRHKNTTRLNHLLADEYVAVGDRGPLDKAAAITYLCERNVTEYAMSDVRATLLGSNSVVLTYSCSARGNWHENGFFRTYWCSDVWVSRGGTWQSVFFIDRPIG
jgi:hypothetical protein